MIFIHLLGWIGADVNDFESQDYSDHFASEVASSSSCEMQ